MLPAQPKPFINRSEAIALFEFLRGRAPDKPRPLLPILGFIAPGGGGKTTLIHHLIDTQCRLTHNVVVPYAHLDFALPGMPKTILSILVELRNQLYQRKDEQGKHLTFPRFDLGAALALAPAMEQARSQLSTDEDEIEQKLRQESKLIKAFDEWGGTVENVVQVIPVLQAFAPVIRLLLTAVKQGLRIRLLDELIERLEVGPNWKWYQSYVDVPPNARITDVLQRLYDLSILREPGERGKYYLEEQVLPAALVEDLRDALDGPQAPRAWNKEVNVVFFLETIEALQGDVASHSAGIPRKIGTLLLERLALAEHRKRGETDPFLFIVSSQQQRLFQNTTAAQDTQTLQHTAREQYERWHQHLPSDKRSLRLDDLYLPLWLDDFGEEDTHTYLEQRDAQEHTKAFTDPEVVQAIHGVTHGHPLYLALAAAAVLEAQARGRTLTLTPDEFEQAPVSPAIDEEHADEQIGEYLLSRFLAQLPHDEQRELIACAAPRALDAGALRAVLHLPSDVEARERWKRYYRLTLTRAIDEERVVFHPVVRTLLLNHLLLNHTRDSDYYRTHSSLLEYFATLANNTEIPVEQEKIREQAQIEEAYHALAVGNTDQAARLALSIYKDTALWERFLDAVAQAPTALMPSHTGELAAQALERARQDTDTEAAVTAVALYTWLLAATKRDPDRTARIENDLGDAYRHLPGGDRQANLEKAIAYSQAASRVYTHENSPDTSDRIQRNLGVVYKNLQGGNRRENLEKTMPYQAAQHKTREKSGRKDEQFRTRDKFPTTGDRLNDVYLPGTSKTREKSGRKDERKQRAESPRARPQEQRKRKDVRPFKRFM